MKKNFFCALLTVLTIGFAYGGKQEDVSTQARQFNSLYNDYSCDLLSDSIDSYLLFSDECFRDGQGDELLTPHADGQYAFIETSDSTVLYLADAYNALIMAHNILSDWETADRFAEDDEDLFAQIADSIRLLDPSILRNDTLNFHIQNIKAFAIDYFLDPSDNSIRAFSDAMDAFYVYLQARTEEIVKTGKEPYINIMNRKAWFADFDSIRSLRGLSDSIYQQELLNKIYLSKSAEERHVYVLEFAHSSDAHVHFLEGAAMEDREFVYYREYSPYLMELWETWRATIGSYFGRSSWSYIPNKVYNQERAKVAEICLNHIAAHPDDQLAQAVLMSIGGIENISRFGSMFGNAAIIEEMSIFPEWENEE